MFICSFIDLLYKYHLFSPLSISLLWPCICLQVHSHFSIQLYSSQILVLLTTPLLSSPCLPRWPVTYKLPLLSPPLILHSWSFSPWNVLLPWLPGTQCSDFSPVPGLLFPQPSPRFRRLNDPGPRQRPPVSVHRAAVLNLPNAGPFKTVSHAVTPNHKMIFDATS